MVESGKTNVSETEGKIDFFFKEDLLKQRVRQPVSKTSDMKKKIVSILSQPFG
jgi:hypothetical protein